jgi:hypothetical protein
VEAGFDPKDLVVVEYPSKLERDREQEGHVLVFTGRFRIRHKDDNEPVPWRE